MREALIVQGKLVIFRAACAASQLAPDRLKIDLGCAEGKRSDHAAIPKLESRSCSAQLLAAGALKLACVVKTSGLDF